MDPFDLRLWKEFKEAGGNSTEPAIIDQIAIDSRRIDSRNALFVALKGGKEDGHQHIAQAARAGAKFAIVSHDWRPSCEIPAELTLLRVPHPLLALQELAKTYRSHLRTKIIGITGSFGKTMVKDLLQTLLSTTKKTAASPESFNSQIGVALSLFTIQQHHEIAIIEAAISHPGEMDALTGMIQPNYTLLTPTGNKHLATLQDLSMLRKETMKLILSTPQNGWSLLPDEEKLQPLLPQIGCPYYFWNRTNANLPHSFPLFSAPLSQYEVTFPDSNHFQGKMNAGHAYFFNLLNMSIKAAWLLNVPSSNIISELNQYQPEPTRTEIWKSSLGTLFVNDTYCSDPQSIDHSLKHFGNASESNRKNFVFGGMREKGLSSHTDYKRIGKALAGANIRHLFLVGDKQFKPLIEEVREFSPGTEILVFDDYPQTFSYLRSHLKDDDFIIFKGEKKFTLDKLTETFNDSLTHNQCIINLAAIQTNLSLIRRHLPGQTRIMVIVKALAYGTDDIQMSKFLFNNGIDILGVSYVDEGIALKRAGIRQSIFSLNATPYEAIKVVKWDLEVGVNDASLIYALAQEASRCEKKIKVHLHINTGMGRFGCRPEEALNLALLIQSLPSLEFEGIMTHFACAEDPQEDPFTLQQISLFDHAIAEIESAGLKPKWKHAANSSGSLRFHLPQYNMVRLGLTVYGFYGSEQAKKTLDLRLAVSLISRVVGINVCKQGESISYGRKYVVKEEEQKIAVLPIGYFDGLHRNYSEKGHVFIRGYPAPMVGNICMDYMMVDVTHIPDIEIGDKALIFGEDEYGYYLSPEDLAQSGNSIIHELMTCLGPRIPRIFIYEEAKEIR